jgi:hypothetical protein
VGFGDNPAIGLILYEHPTNFGYIPSGLILEDLFCKLKIFGKKRSA